MNIKNIFNEPKSASEIEEDNERLKLEDEQVGYKLSIAKQNALIKELEARGKKWQDFSNNGKRSGISIDKIRAFFSSH